MHILCKLSLLSEADFVERERERALMGLSTSKQVSRTFHDSLDFNSVCDSVYEECLTLGPVEFKAFTVDLFTDAVVSNTGKAVLRRVPTGVAAIAGIGVMTRSGKDLVGTAIGVYALGVATSIYLSLAG